MNPARASRLSCEPTPGGYRHEPGNHRYAPGHFDTFAAKTSQAAASLKGWSAEELGRIGAPALLVFGDHDFLRSPVQWL